MDQLVPSILTNEAVSPAGIALPNTETACEQYKYKNVPALAVGKSICKYVICELLSN